ncbi:MAG: nucleotidyltransferase domain-containing protein [Anaerolineae bacterium]|nr:nucleotidyltransferase domain-containing protein [Anaerolineae bacterium]
MNDIDKLRNGIRTVADEVAIDIAYLFGSRAESNAHSECMLDAARIGPLSDYDLGVLLHRKLATDAAHLRVHFAAAMTARLGTDLVDVVILNEAPIELAYAVIAQGQILYERSVTIRVEYEAYVLGLYGDYLPVLREHRAQILEGGDYAKRVQRYRTALGRTRRTLGAIASATSHSSG